MTRLCITLIATLYLGFSMQVNAEIYRTSGVLETDIDYKADGWKTPYKMLLQTQVTNKLAFIIYENNSLPVSTFLVSPNVEAEDGSDLEGDEYRPMSVSVHIPEIKIVCVAPRIGVKWDSMTAPKYCPKSYVFSVDLVQGGDDGTPLTVLDSDEILFNLICEPRFCWMRARNINLLNNHANSLQPARIQIRSLQTIKPDPWTFKMSSKWPGDPDVGFVSTSNLGFIEIQLNGKIEALIDSRL